MSDSAEQTTAVKSRPLKVDAHVHLYPGFDLEVALSSAAEWMELSEEAPTGVLLLTETAGTDSFARMPRQAGPWKMTSYEESTSVWAFDDDGRCILIVAGRQIVTDEDLEVHAFGTRATVPDGVPLEETIKHIRSLGALAALPWGVGKWTGKRGELITRMSGQRPPEGVFLADSGVRMRGTIRPRVLADAEANGWVVLAGTDPLPIDGQDTEVGRYGFKAPLVLNGRQPFADLSAWLLRLRQSPSTYGTLQSPMRFAGSQVTMQWRKRMR